MVHSTLLAEDPALSLDSIQFDLEPGGTVGVKLGKNPLFGLLVACKQKSHTFYSIREQHFVSVRIKVTNKLSEPNKCIYRDGTPQNQQNKMGMTSQYFTPSLYLVPFCSVVLV